MWNGLSCIMHNLSLLIYIFKYIFTMQTFSFFLYKYICVRVTQSDVKKRNGQYLMWDCEEIQYKMYFLSWFLCTREQISTISSNSLSPSHLFSCPFLPLFFLSFFVFLPFLFPWFLKYSSDWFLCLFAQVLNIKRQIAKTTKVQANNTENNIPDMTGHCRLYFRTQNEIMEKRCTACVCSPKQTAEMSRVHSLDWDCTIITTNTR